MTRRPARIGLLPLYLKLYDDRTPDLRRAFAGFLEQVEQGFAAQGTEVVRSEICRVAPEFEAAAALFDGRDVDCIVTLHLAYSPSLESAAVLEKATRPIIMLDSTMDAGFGTGVEPERLLYNHGVHGVMDLASVLRRRGRHFEIVAGHVAESNVMERAAALAQAAYAARCFRNTKALRVGEAFRGMGDFSVEESALSSLGVRLEAAGMDELQSLAERVTEREVTEEVARDCEQFACDLPEEVHRRSVRAGLGLRQKLEQGGYSAFSMNFLAFDRKDGAMSAVPFLEASKAMSRGIGYAGEGDVLTAALVGALIQGFGRATFTEVFCPDWEGNSLFLSHMGEVNPDIAAERPRVVEKDFPYTPAANPAILACAPAAGPGVFVNLAPGPKGAFTLLVAPVEVVDASAAEAMRDIVHGWIRPAGGIEIFLQDYSRMGGTHHSALVLGERTEAVIALARFAGLECRVLAG